MAPAKDSVPITVRLSRDTVRRIEIAAERRSPYASRGSIVREAVESLLREIEHEQSGGDGQGTEPGGDGW